MELLMDGPLHQKSRFGIVLSFRCVALTLQPFQHCDIRKTGHACPFGEITKFDRLKNALQNYIYTGRVLESPWILESLVS